MKNLKMPTLFCLLAIVALSLFSCKQEKTLPEPQTIKTTKKPPTLKYRELFPMTIWGKEVCESAQTNPCAHGYCDKQNFPNTVCYVIQWPEDESPALIKGGQTIPGVDIKNITFDALGNVTGLQFITLTDTFTMSNSTSWSW